MKFFALIFAMLFAACGHDFNPCPKPTQSPCPTIEPCPLPIPCPDATPCPDCPAPVPCPEASACPLPPVVPNHPDVTHALADFDVTAVLVTKDLMGVFVSDPNGQFEPAVFPMPELIQKIQFEQVLSLNVSMGDQQPDTPVEDITVDIGTTEGEVDELGLVVSVLCGREFSNACTASVVSNGNQLTALQVDLLATQQSFGWKSK